MKILLIFCALLITTGCLSMMTAADWERFESNARENGWTEVRIAEFRADAVEREQAALAATRTIIHTAIDAVPVPVDKEPWKDLADFALYGILGVSALGGGEVVRRKVKNSEPGKLFGPLNKKGTA